MRTAYGSMTKLLSSLFLAFLLTGSQAVAGEDDQDTKKEPARDIPEANPKTRVRLGGISLGGFYRHYSNLEYYPYYYPAFFGPSGYYWWPYYDLAFAPYHPGFYNGFARAPGNG